MRTLIAYGLILLVVAAVTAVIIHVRRNSHERKIFRQREREQARRDELHRNP